MRLLQLADEPFDSGIVHYALTLSQALQNRGHRVVFGGRRGRFPLAEARRLGLPCRAIRPFPSGLVDLRRVLQEENIELVNAHTGSSHTSAVAASSLLARSIPVVRTRGDSRTLRRSAAGNLLWKRTTAFIAPTERILSDFKAAYPGLPIRSRAVLPGIPSSQTHAENLPPFPPIKIGLLGRLDPVKGHVSFLRAAADALTRVPGARFLIAGREENLRIAELRQTAHRLGLSGKATFEGHVPDALEFMRGCHIGVVASIGSEAVSRAALEWMACARPLVATNVGCLPEIVEEGTTGFLVSPKDFERMARRIIELAADPALRSRMGQAAFARFQRRFSMERFAAETENFYESILLSCRSRRSPMDNAGRREAEELKDSARQAIG